MSKINTSNYEAYFIDHLEGNLSESDTILLMQFLNQYPELKNELEEFEVVKVNDAPTTLEESFKSQLLKEEETALSRLDYLLIAELEGQLSPEETRELNRLEKADSNLQNEKRLFAKTVLKSSESLVFFGKEQLKHKGNVIVLYQRVAAIAAILIAALFFGQTLIKDPLYKPEMASITKTEAIVNEDSETTFPNLVIEETAVPKTQIEQLNKEKPVNQKYFAELKSNEVQPSKEEDEFFPSEIAEVSTPLTESNTDEAENIHSTEVNTNDQIEDQIVENTNYEIAENTTESQSNSSQKDFVPVSDFAKQRIKENLLKNKTLSEAIAAEIAKATNDKVTFDQVINKNGKREKFAINIGKLKISKNN